MKNAYFSPDQLFISKILALFRYYSQVSNLSIGSRKDLNDTSSQKPYSISNVQVRRREDSLFELLSEVNKNIR